MSEMIERVAKVIWNIHSSSFNDGVGLDDDLMYLDMARAAIEAIRDPTIEMEIAAQEDWMCVRAVEDRGAVIWRAMVDAALSSQDGKAQP